MFLAWGIRGWAMRTDAERFQLLEGGRGVHADLYESGWKLFSVKSQHVRGLTFREAVDNAMDLCAVSKCPTCGRWPIGTPFTDVTCICNVPFGGASSEVTACKECKYLTHSFDDDYRCKAVKGGHSYHVDGRWGGPHVREVNKDGHCKYFKGKRVRA